MTTMITNNTVDNFYAVQLLS